MESQIPTESKTTTTRGVQDSGAKCRAAKALASSGDYEAAREALGDLWGGIGKRPDLEGLSPRDQAEVLLRVGALSGWLGSSSQVPGAQGFAKDLISESIRAFEAIEDQEKTAEAQSDLALCYWREGAMDEARVWLRQALSSATKPGNVLRVLVISAIVELTSSHLGEALVLLDQAAPFVEEVEDDATLGCYHMERAIIFNRLGGVDNFDRALLENTAASIHFEKANHRRYYARVENNMGLIFQKLGRFAEALEHLERARHTFVALGDVGTAAQVNETRARVFIAQQRYVDAEKIAFAAVSELEKGDEQSLLAEALETQAVALARMGRFQSAQGILKRAAQIAETAGDVQLSGKIFLTVLEEVKSFLSPAEITEMYREADERLPETLDPATMSRLRACARLGAANAATPRRETASGGSFEEQVHKREAELINAALLEAGGSVTRAARQLKLTHQGLCYIINHRHKELLSARAPIRVRRKSIIKKR
jgi:tetratricopeptide (TPR) repeat protein